MNTYVGLLRGINVSGQKKIRMADLKVLLEELGWEQIQTYIQSGNIIFKSKKNDPALLSRKMKEKILDSYGFEVPALVMAPETLRHIINHNPFISEPGTDIDRLYVTFLLNTPSADLSRKLESLYQENERFVLEDKIIFLYYPDGYGRARMNNNVFEKVLKVEATTRNWKTVNKLYELAQYP